MSSHRKLLSALFMSLLRGCEHSRLRKNNSSYNVRIIFNYFCFELAARIDIFIQYFVPRIVDVADLIANDGSEIFNRHLVAHTKHIALPLAILIFSGLHLDSELLPVLELSEGIRYL